MQAKGVWDLAEGKASAVKEIHFAIWEAPPQIKLKLGDPAQLRVVCGEEGGRRLRGSKTGRGGRRARNGKAECLRGAALFEELLCRYIDDFSRVTAADRSSTSFFAAFSLATPASATATASSVSLAARVSADFAALNSSSFWRSCSSSAGKPSLRAGHLAMVRSLASLSAFRPSATLVASASIRCAAARASTSGFHRAHLDWVTLSCTCAACKSMANH